MLIPANLLGILLALASGFVWGSGDFAGGYASRRDNAYTVLSVSAFSGLVVLIIVALALREPFPELDMAIWAMLGGLSGAVGIAALYRGLSLGHAASVAPVAGVISAALPVIYGAVAHGFPGALRLLGFVLALAGIWLVSGGGRAVGEQSRRELLLAGLAGVGFGFFFIFLGLVETSVVFTPLILTRTVTLLTGLALMRFYRLPLPPLTSNPPALLAGVLDAGGNLLYIVANQYTRLDIAAVLASLYPAATVLLSALIVKEKVSLRQGVGVATCLAAIVLITV